MTVLGLCILITSIAMAAIQFVYALKLISTFKKTHPQLLEDEECPDAVAILCLRGTDPFLPNMLRKLFEQDYPRYRVRVVIDSDDDPARPVVEDAIHVVGATHVEVLTLKHHDPHCAARSSSILKGTDQLPGDCRIVAMFDGDVVLHPLCLRELVTSLINEKAKVATGIRWFAPRLPTIGSIARLQWSLECTIMMHAMRLPWGGCLAMWREVIEDPDLRGRISRSFGDDMLLGSLLDQRDENLVFVPSSTIVNRETTSLKGLLNFLIRHMLYVRLNHHRWRSILGFGTFLVLLMSVVCPMGLLHPALRPWCLAALASLLACVIGTMIGVGHAARKCVAARGEELIAMTPVVIVTMLVAAPITQLFTLLSNVAACTTRQITWRGLTYRFGRDPEVTLIREVPVAQLQQYSTCAMEKSP